MSGHRQLAIAALSTVVLIAGCSNSDSDKRSGTSGAGTPTQLAVRAFEDLEQGEQSGVQLAGEQLVTDRATWDLLYSEHSRGAIPAPAVDFATEAVIAAFQGPQPNLGYRTEVVRVDTDVPTGNVFATVRAFVPGSWRSLPDQLSSPYHFVTTPAPARGAQLGVFRQQLLDVEEMFSGSQSPIGSGDPSFQGDIMVFRSQADFDGFMRLHSTIRPPAIDFTRQMIVAVLAGYRGSFGHRIETKRIVHDPAQDAIRVDFTVHPYRGGAAPPQVTETPWQVLRANLVPGTIRAEIRQSLPVTQLSGGQFALYQGLKDILVVRDQASFDNLAQSVLPGIPKPLIDFSAEQVIVAFLGPQNFTGYSIQVRSADMLEDGEVELTVNHADPFGRPTATPTSPYHLVRMPRTFGPVKARFVNTTPVP